MPFWNRKRIPRNNLLSSYSPSSASAPTSPGRTDGGGSGLGLPKDHRVHYSSRRCQPQPRLIRQNNLRRLMEHELNALCLDAVEDASSSTSVSGSLSNHVASAAATSSTPVSRSRSPSELYNVPVRSASSPIVSPRPLPLPESVTRASPPRELRSGRNVFLSPEESAGGPLPRDFSTVDGLGGGIDAAAEPTPRDSGLGRSSKELNSTGTTSNGIALNIPAKSALTGDLLSPAASPVRIARRSSGVASLVSTSVNGIPGFHVLSEPEILQNSVSASSSQASPKIMQSNENSPVYGLAIKNYRRPRNHSAPASPLHRAMHSDIMTAWHDRGGNVNVHPLPLPPGASSKIDGPVVASQWRKRKLIGSGTFGNVYVATNSYNGALCAMKEVNIIPDDSRSAECLKQLEQEIQFLSQFKHPNIVQYYGSEMIQNQLYIYLEYVHPGSVNKYVRQYYGVLPERIVRSFTHHILKGLAYLHDKKIMHRDIKGANLLVDVNGVVKLADFGMAKHNADFIDQLNGATNCHSMKGSAFWMAPEMLQATMNKKIVYDVAVDIWSLGCTIIEMFTGNHPWSGLQEAQAMFNVLNYDPPIPETLSMEGKDFLQCCFRRNPAERPTANKLLEHPFVERFQHHSLNSPVQAITEIRPNDYTFSPSNGGKPKRCLFVKRKPTSIIDNIQLPSYPENFESATSHLSARLIPKLFSSLSPRSKFTASNAAGSSTLTQHGALSSDGKHQLYVQRRFEGKDYATSF
ncbi:hypothetical protein ZIOFF_057130 [Zingiber officinale]|uniref:mitogen-activated protein kinase kinase kinase n=1 Tax=Zingiber officinale TaxID=94328 RepID=A0A8J5F8R6_ZINOF|nr:hypothetical protein ZIOFF_057130 [Zingiber officinale]